MSGGSEERTDGGSAPLPRFPTRQAKPLSRLDPSSEWSKSDIRRHSGTREGHTRVRTEGESYAERGAARDEARAEAAALRGERDALRQQIDSLRDRVSALVQEAHDSLDEPALEPATAVITAEALQETIAELSRAEHEIADGPACPSVMLGGELGTRVRLSLADGALHCSGAGLNLSVGLDDIAFVDDACDESAVLLVMSRSGEEKSFYFGRHASSLSTMDAFEQRLNTAIKEHAASKAVAEQDARERVLEQAAAGRDSRATATSNGRTRVSKCKRAGRELLSALSEISKLESKHANKDAREKMTAVVAADTAHDPAQLSADAARRQKESAGKQARNLRDQLFAVGGIHQTRQTLQCLLAMPCVQLALGEGPAVNLVPFQRCRFV